MVLSSSPTTVTEIEGVSKVLAHEMHLSDYEVVLCS